MLDTFDIGRILRQALAGGGEFADIYFEEGTATVISCEDATTSMFGASSGPPTL